MKDPAFLFYSSDFLSGITDLTMEERGQYITLLCLQHQKGTLTEKTIKITVPNISNDVLAKFLKDEDGNYFNKRLSDEVAKRKIHSEKQREKVLKRWEKSKKDDTNEIPNKYHGITTVIPLVNENENEDVIVKEKIKNMCTFFKFSEMSFPQQFFAASEFINCLVHRNQIEHFDKQFIAYKQVKKDGYTHSFKKFIGTPELFYEDGAWNSENWESKTTKTETFEVGKNNDDKYRNMKLRSWET